MIAVLYTLGVNGYALLAGGTFAGLVIGLASQTALANFVAGVVLLLARPFLPGDRITMSTAQFSMLMPVYPPKFYSQDLLIPGFTGSVQDIGLMYTSVRLDEGPIAWFPNSIVLMAAIILHNVDERWVRVKYRGAALDRPGEAPAEDTGRGGEGRLGRGEGLRRRPGEPGDDGLVRRLSGCVVLREHRGSAPELALRPDHADGGLHGAPDPPVDLLGADHGPAPRGAATPQQPLRLGDRRDEALTRLRVPPHRPAPHPS